MRRSNWERLAAITRCPPASVESTLAKSPVDLVVHQVLTAASGSGFGSSSGSPRVGHRQGLREMRVERNDSTLQYSTSRHGTEARIYRCETVDHTSHSVGIGAQAVCTGWPLGNSTKRTIKAPDHLFVFPAGKTDAPKPIARDTAHEVKGA